MPLKWPGQRWAAVLIGFASAAVLAMHAFLGSYSRFIADDYCSAAESQRLGILRAAWFWYRTWNGRYSANVLDALFGALGPGFTPVVTALVLIAWLVALSAAILTLLAAQGERQQSLISFALAPSILLLTLTLAPDVPQALYWGQGMRSVIPPLLLVTLEMALFWYFEPRPWSSRLTALWMALSLILAYGAGGFSETYAALQVVAFGLMLALWILAKQRSATKNGVFFLSAGLVGAILALITVIISPGNPIRAAFFPPPPPLFALLRIAFGAYGLFFWHILASPLKLLGLITALVIGLWAGAHSSAGPRGWKAALWILLIGAALTFSSFPPAAYGESDVPPDRTLIIPTYILVLTVILLGVALSQPLIRRWRSLLPLSPVAVPLVWVVAAICMLQLIAVQPTYAAYARAWSRFDTQMADYREAGIASVQISTSDMNASNWSRLNVLGDNPKFWLNKCVSDYYGVRVISSTP